MQLIAMLIWQCGLLKRFYRFITKLMTICNYNILTIRMKLDGVRSIEVKAILQFRKMTSFVKARRIGLIEKCLNNKRNKEVEKKI